MKKIWKKKALVFFATCIFTVLLFGLFSKYYDVQPKFVTLVMEMSSDNIDEYQVFYRDNKNENWDEKKSAKAAYTSPGEYKKLKFNIPIDSEDLRIDFGTSPKSIQVKKIYLDKWKTYDLSKSNLDKLQSQVKDLNITTNSDEELDVESLSNDSFIELSGVKGILTSINYNKNILQIAMIVLSLVCGYILAQSFFSLKDAIKFLGVSFNNVRLIKSLSKNDFKNKYASSYLGIVWGFISPLVTIVVYWFVFQVGFRSQDVGDVPYVLWFIAGIIPWFYFSEALPSATYAFLEYSYLV